MILDIPAPNHTVSHAKHHIFPCVTYDIALELSCHLPSLTTTSSSQARCSGPQTPISAKTSAHILPKKCARTRQNGPILRRQPSSPPCSNRRLPGTHLRVASSPLFGHWWSSQ